MATIGNTPRPGYVYDTETDTWVPIGVGAHTHAYIPNTLVDAKGDILTATANDVPARLGIGANGTVLVSDSTTSTGLAWQPYAAQQVAGKNYFINGGMDFWQRGTSFTSTSGAYTADRWKATVNQGGTTYVVSRQAANLEGFQYCLRFQRASGQTYTAGSFIGYAWTPEDAVLMQGKTVTYSFYARKGSDFSSTSPSSGISAQLQQGTGNGSHAFSALTNETNVISGNATLTTSWQRFSFTGTVAANTTELRTNIAHSPSGTAGANDYYEITGLQLEIGPIATSFSRYAGTYQGELAACQRYYWRMSSDTVYQAFGMGFWEPSNSIILTFVDHPVVMRVNPTSIDYAGPMMIYDGATGIGVNSISIGSFGSRKRSRINLSLASAATSNRPYELLSNASTTPYLGFNAEL